MPFSVWLIALSIISSRFIHVIANGRISCFLMTERYCIICITCSLFLHHEHLGCSHELWCRYLFETVSLFIRVHTQKWYVYMVAVFLNFLRKLHTFTVVAPIYIPTKSSRDSLFSIPLPALVITCFFDSSYSNRSE